MHERTEKLVYSDRGSRYSFWIADNLYHCWDSMNRILYASKRYADYEKWKAQAAIWDKIMLSIDKQR